MNRLSCLYVKMQGWCTPKVAPNMRPVSVLLFEEV